MFHSKNRLPAEERYYPDGAGGRAPDGFLPEASHAFELSEAYLHVLI